MERRWATGTGPRDRAERVPRRCPFCKTTFEIEVAALRRGRGKYCSPSCAKSHYWAKRDRPATRYVYERAADHPLAHANGVVLAHRRVLYDAIGVGPHCCHWCGQKISWHMGPGREPAGSIIADHLDSNSQNNSRENLVPSCRRCNWNRENPRAIKADEPFVWKGGKRQRIKKG